MTTAATRPPAGGPPGPAREPEAAPSFVERLLKPARPLRLTPGQAGALAAGIGGFTLFVGIVLGPSVGLLFLAALVGSAVAVVALVVPWVALGLMVMLEFANVSGVFEERSPVSIYTAMLALGIMSALVALARPQYRARIRTRWWLPVALYVVYMVSQVPSTLQSAAPEASANSLDNMIKDGVFLAVMLLLMQLANRPWMVGAAIVLAIAPIAGLTAINQYVYDNGTTFGGFSNIASTAGASIAAARHAGPLPDSNFWGRFLVLGLPFALALVHRAGQAGHRLAQVLWIGAAMLVGLGLYLTQSRGTFLAAAVAVLVWIIASGPTVRRYALYLTPAALVGLLIPGVGDRLLTITETLSTPAYAADASIIERGNVLEAAISVFRENPLLGTGPGSFGSVITEYAALAGTGPTGTITATHNLYLEIASESGLVGLAGWFVFYGGVVALGVSAVLRLAGGRRDGRHGVPSRALAAAGVAALIGWGASSIFLHQSYSRTLLVICAFVGWIYSTSRSEASLRRPAAADATTAAAVGLRFGMVATALTTALACVVAAALYAVMERPTYVATAELTMQATADTYPGYALDVRRRVLFLPTFAAVIEGGLAQSATTVTGDPNRGTMTVRSVAADPAEAVALRDSAVLQADGIVEGKGLGSAYDVIPIAIDEVTEQRPLSNTTLRVIALATLFQIGLVVAGCSWFRNHGRRGARFT
ncbi:O-antigen ligase family protein [Pseudonocardia sp.]|uniref:O-antigen ligase family protein n=1 Tax=Pseudonocardia sp. TaxID=60912 RepID=UPI002621E54B|nr:O-antigen ligase family protein [Pseudonocardia sp.]